MIDYYRHKHQHKRRHVDCDYDGYVDDNKYRGDGGGGGLTYVFPAALALTSSSSHSASSASSIVSNSKHRYHKNFHHLGLTKSIIETSVDYCPAKVICFSACADVQKSAGISNVDKLGMSFVPKGSDGGACTSLFLQILYQRYKKESAGKELPPLTYGQVLHHMHRVCERNGYNQLPQLTSSRPVRLEKDPFFVVPPKFDSSKNTKRALLIGINYRDTPFELTGCHNDCRHMRHFLRDAHDFKDEDIVMMLDHDDDGNVPAALRPTKANLCRIFQQFALTCKEGDVIVIHFSGHGVSLSDGSDGSDEAIMPCDYLTNGEIVDHDIFRLLLIPMPRNVYVTAVLDCCHSGSILGLPFEYTLRQDGTFDCDYDAVAFPHQKIVEDYQVLQELQASPGRMRYPVLERDSISGCSERTPESFGRMPELRSVPVIRGRSPRVSDLSGGKLERTSKSLGPSMKLNQRRVQRSQSPKPRRKIVRPNLKTVTVSPETGGKKKPSVKIPLPGRSKEMPALASPSAKRPIKKAPTGSKALKSLDDSTKKKMRTLTRPRAVSLSPTRFKTRALLTPTKSVQSRSSVRPSPKQSRAASTGRKEILSIPKPPFGLSDSTLKTDAGVVVEIEDDVQPRSRSMCKNQSVRNSTTQEKQKKVQLTNVCSSKPLMQKKGEVATKKKDQHSYQPTTPTRSPTKYGRHATIGVSSDPQPSRRAPPPLPPRPSTPNQSVVNKQNRTNKGFRKVVPNHYPSNSSSTSRLAHLPPIGKKTTVSVGSRNRPRSFSPTKIRPSVTRTTTRNSFQQNYANGSGNSPTTRSHAARCHSVETARRNYDHHHHQRVTQQNPKKNQYDRALSSVSSSSTVTPLTQIPRKPVASRHII